MLKNLRKAVASFVIVTVIGAIVSVPILATQQNPDIYDMSTRIMTVRSEKVSLGIYDYVKRCAKVTTKANKFIPYWTASSVEIQGNGKIIVPTVRQKLYPTILNQDNSIERDTGATWSGLITAYSSHELNSNGKTIVVYGVQKNV